MIKPQKLQVGDTIGLVSPSGPLAGMLPHRTEQGIKALEAMGFNVKLSKNALAKKAHAAGTPQQRAEDINAMFADPEIKAIISFIGGFHSNQILKYLDFEMIKKNPKVFMGFSDMSVLHMALNTQADLVTFYGPAVLTQFAEPFGVDEYTLDMFKKSRNV